MSKTAASKQPEAKKPATDPFADYKKVEAMVQLDGYWQPEAGPIHGVLVAGFEYKQKNGRSKGQLRTVFVFKLLSPCVATVTDTNGKRDTQQLNRAELCGVFGSAGMNDLRELAGCSVLMIRKPEKKVLGNGNEMWEFDIKYKGQQKPLSIRKALAKQAPPDADDVSDADENWAEAF